ncbi:MAG: hypothetical protein HZY73_08820 [Micropruina sp.]|nr:MAG: hypothetical protein HZY73_08820 [Micropruina sp.]
MSTLTVASARYTGVRSANSEISRSRMLPNSSGRAWFSPIRRVDWVTDTCSQTTSWWPSSSRMAGVITAPPPRDTTPGWLRARSVAAASRSRKNGSPSSAKISRIRLPCSASMTWSTSTWGSPSRRASR